MKRILIAILFILLPGINVLQAQQRYDNQKIDLMLLNGSNRFVIDTCRVILASDSLRADVWYRMGIAFQNLISDDMALDCFSKAAALDSANNGYNFTLAKALLGKGRNTRARTLLQTLCTGDSLNWPYHFYLTSIYMQEGKYDQAIEVYDRFYAEDSLNINMLDKRGFALLRKGDFDSAIETYGKSLAKNPLNTNAIKNLSYLFASTNRADTAVKLLTRGIETDSNDIDLFIRRGGIYYLQNYTKRALDDYLRVLKSGDSSVLYLKRIGIGYRNNLQPGVAIPFLLKAYSRDSSDYETTSYLGQCYYNTNDFKKALYYYKRVVKLLTPITQQMGVSRTFLAEAQKSTGKYKEAIASFQEALKISGDINLYMIIANLYDEKLNDPVNAIKNYEIFLGNQDRLKPLFRNDYVESVRKRLAFLKENQKKK